MFPYFSKNSEHDHNFIQTASKSSKKHHECMRATEWSEPSLWPSPDRRQISSLPRYGKTLMEPYMPLFPGAIGALRESEPVSVLEKMDAMEIVFFPTSPEVYCIGSNCYIFFKIHKFWKNRTTRSPKVQKKIKKIYWTPNFSKLRNKQPQLATGETGHFSGTKKHPICPNPWPTFRQPGKGFTGKAGKSLTHQCQGERRGDVG